ncbi:MAG: DUF4149 domain-containing protein [Planctomycetota bacterium]
MEDSKGRRFVGWALRAFTLATFAVWFGGLTFYMAWVVPIGTDELGSAFAQGMITRRVTSHINVLAAVALLVMLGDALVNREPVRWRKRTKLISILLMMLMGGGLFWMHPQIDALIDLNERSITDYDLFYFRHRVYLWITTIQWIAAWFWLGAMAAPSRKPGV